LNTQRDIQTYLKKKEDKHIQPNRLAKKKRLTHTIIQTDRQKRVREIEIRQYNMKRYIKTDWERRKINTQKQTRLVSA